MTKISRKRLRELVRVQNGFAFKSAFFGKEGMPLIRIRDLKNGAGSDTRYAGEFSDSYVVKSGDLLIGMDGEFGCFEWRGENALLNQRVCKIEIASKELDRRFFLYGINSYLKEIEARTSFTTVKHLSSKQILDIEFAYPPLTEQNRIVEMLDEAFGEIAKIATNTERNLAKARELLHAQLAGMIDEQRKAAGPARLMDMCDQFGRGKSRHRPRNDPRLYGGPYPFIQTGDLSGDKNYLEVFSQSYSDIGLAQSKLWPSGTVCIAIVGATIGESSILSFDACFPDSVIGMVASSGKAIPEYIQYLLVAHKAEIKSKGVGSARHNINLGTFENQKFPFPPISKQWEIVEALNELWAHASRLQDIQRQKLDLLDELRSSLLSKAFSGQLTDKDAIAA
jgi:type I restriction enzyme S subunit